MHPEYSTDEILNVKTLKSINELEDGNGELFTGFTEDFFKILIVSDDQSQKDYELRPEIEEDFRQMKDFGNLEEGRACIGKSLPVVAKNYKEKRPKSVVIYVGQYFGIFPFLEFLQLYAECTLEVRRLLDRILVKV